MNSRYDYIGDSVGIIFTAIQSNELFQLIGFILTILSIVISIAYSIYQWWKEAKKDGKITKEEINDVISNVKKQIDKHQDNKKGE